MINKLYQEILAQILDEKNSNKYQTLKYADQYTGMVAHPNEGYISFTVNPSESFPLITLRDVGLKLFIAEMIWYLSGTIDPVWIRKYTKIWDDFADEDGLVRSSYGYRWRNHFGRDQILSAISLLKRDPSSRQAVIMTWDPSCDGLDTERQKNVPCVPMMQFLILNNKLILDVVWRSNDMYLGFPHDLAGFSLLQAIVAQKMSLEVGKLHYSILHSHLYDNQIESAKILLETASDQPKVELFLPENSFDIARDGTDEQRDELYTQIFDNLNSQYKPVQKLKKIKIVV